VSVMLELSRNDIFHNVIRVQAQAGPTHGPDDSSILVAEIGRCTTRAIYDPVHVFDAFVIRSATAKRRILVLPRS